MRRGRLLTSASDVDLAQMTSWSEAPALKIVLCLKNSDSKARWFLQTGAYGAAFGVLALLTQHLLAPVAMHATLNVGLCARDWQRMRNTPAEELARIFAEGEE